MVATGEVPYRFNRRTGWDLRPGATFEGETIGPDGFRGPQYPHEKGRDVVRIIVLGESASLGFGVSDAQSWPRLLEQLLRARNLYAEVVNLGVTGFTIVQGARLYDLRAGAYEPDVVIVAYGAVNEQFCNPDQLTDKQRLALLNDPVQRLHRFLQRWALGRLMSRRASPVHSADDNCVRRVPVPDFLEALDALTARIVSDGATPVLVSPARRIDAEYMHAATVEYTRSILEFTEQRDILLVPSRHVLRQLETQAMHAAGMEPLGWAERSPWFLDGWHPSAEGHRAIAEHMLAVFEAKGLFLP